MRISLEQARRKILKGEVVGIPTETVYGLAASLNNPSAIDQIFSLKGRPATNPLIIHIAQVTQLRDYAISMPGDITRLTQAFWPGPLTIVLPAKQEVVPTKARAGLSTAAFRMPAHSLTLALIEWLGPLVMPSANLSGKPSATSREHVEADFGENFPVLDGGKCQKGVESTILHYENRTWHIVRLGALAPEAFLPVLGYAPEIVESHSNDGILCPGQHLRHYAPQAKLLLDQPLQKYAGVVIGFSDRVYPAASKVLVLGPSTDAVKCAENLFGVLRQLDVEQIGEAAVDLGFPDHGLWITIAERLMRAAEVDSSSL